MVIIAKRRYELLSECAKFMELKIKTKKKNEEETIDFVDRYAVSSQLKLKIIKDFS